MEQNRTRIASHRVDGRHAGAAVAQLDLIMNEGPHRPRARLRGAPQHLARLKGGSDGVFVAVFVAVWVRNLKVGAVG